MASRDAAHYDKLSRTNHFSKCTPKMSIHASKNAIGGLTEYREAEREAYNSADLRLVDRFAEDFILTSNGVPTVYGRDAARELFRGIWSNNHAKFVEVRDEEVVEAGEYLFVNGGFVLELTPKLGGEKVLDRGRYLAVLRRGTDGKYQLWREATMDTGEEQPGSS